MKRIAIAAVLIPLFSAAPLLRASPTKQPAPAKASGYKAPSTADEHLAAAKTYRDYASGERRQIQKHLFMIQRRREVPGQVQPSEWYFQHCQKLADAASEAAKSAEALADYHEKQAKELRAKGSR